MGHEVALASSRKAAAITPDASKSPGASAAQRASVGTHSKLQQSRHQQRRQRRDCAGAQRRQRVKVVGKCSQLQGAGVVLVKVPASWAEVWLRVLCKCGAVAVGEQEATACQAAAGLQCFPQDFPASQAYWCASLT